MKKVIVTLAIAMMLASCEKSLPKTGAVQEDPKTIAFNLAKEKSYPAIKAHIDTFNKENNATLDSLIIVSVDTATEKMGFLNLCLNKKNDINNISKAIQLQEKLVEATKPFGPAMSKVEIQTLKILKLKLEIETANYEELLEKAAQKDSTNFSLYKLKTQAIRTTPRGKDTLNNYFFVDSLYQLKKF